MSDRAQNPNRRVAPTVPREQFDAVLRQLHEAREEKIEVAQRAQDQVAKHVYRAESAEAQLKRCQEALRAGLDWHDEKFPNSPSSVTDDLAAVIELQRAALSQQSVPNTPTETDSA